jgi:hypothetical protein
LRFLLNYEKSARVRGDSGILFSGFIERIRNEGRKKIQQTTRPPRTRFLLMLTKQAWRKRPN